VQCKRLHQVGLARIQMRLGLLFLQLPGGLLVLQCWRWGLHSRRVLPGHLPRPRLHVPCRDLLLGRLCLVSGGQLFGGVWGDELCGVRPVLGGELLERFRCVNMRSDIVNLSMVYLTSCREWKP
jgi:hypothetical protein